MRIIGGTWRSRRLLRPETDSTRPMPDRVKQAIFDMLGSRYDTPGALPSLLVADVFAGGGSMGLEALSRGAASCSFYERGREALEALRGNIESLGAGSVSRVVAGDAWSATMSAPDGRPFALIFLDPPYRDCEDTTELGEIRRFLRRLSSPNTRECWGDRSLRTASAEECLVVLHHPAGTRFARSPSDPNTRECLGERSSRTTPWRVVEERRIGSNAVTFIAS